MDFGFQQRQKPKMPLNDPMMNQMDMGMFNDPMMSMGMFNDPMMFDDVGMNPYISQKFKGVSGSELFKQKTDTEKTLLEIELLLKSERIIMKSFETKDGEVIQVPKREPIPNVEPLVNDIGVYRILNWLKGVFHKDAVQGNIEKKEFHNLVGDFCVEFMQFLVVHRKEFNLTYDNINTIHQAVYDAFYLYLTRPVNNLERVINGGGQIIEHINQPQNNNGEGFLKQLWSGMKSK